MANARKANKKATKKIKSVGKCGDCGKKLTGTLGKDYFQPNKNKVCKDCQFKE